MQQLVQPKLRQCLTHGGPLVPLTLVPLLPITGRGAKASLQAVMLLVVLPVTLHQALAPWSVRHKASQQERGGVTRVLCPHPLVLVAGARPLWLRPLQVLLELPR